VARQPSGRGSAGEPQARAEPTVEDEADLDLDDEDLDDESGAEASAIRSTRTDALWTEVRIDPVEIALPHGVGYTLRAHRPSAELASPDIGDRDDDFPGAVARVEEDEVPEIDEEELTRLALAAGDGDRQPRATRGRADEDEPLDAEGDEEAAARRRDADEADDEADDEAEAEADDSAEEDDADEEAADEDEPEDVPVFLAHRGRLLLFRSAEGLVEYVRSDAQHDLVQLDTWAEVRNRVQVEDIVPNEADTYELDLVVENLRGGPDAWDAGLLIQAGEAARDIGYALRLEPVVTALSPGSPLDDLDDALRAAEAGGIGAFFARRKVRKIRSETAALGWRTIIGKISALVDWRD
jgi:hypothetical protein